ncbi:hypothetical protein M419DRAFT_8478 [Trichoderma reesei RUT C-30]|jgi:hypothetical protein|uniref:Uncharacterized protein n=1 Tax=Hypocrea jecorina (strain ATCC 56765 / BCRC 32924 / NRRL 11460 / Rut C-30) TaxID=1344414 RepID=A0A024SC65_HYPJR|nr:hypothetical protein M419DRAFT_8478 [Trichoderma reesei RUT C-30]
MIDNLQCQTHTRTPWGSSPHRYDPRIRYLAMGLLCASVLAIFTVSLVFVGNSAVRTYSSSSSSDDDDTTASTSIPLSTEIPLSTTNISATRLNQNTSETITTITITGLKTLLSPTITVPLDETKTADIG